MGKQKKSEIILIFKVDNFSLYLYKIGNRKFNCHYTDRWINTQIKKKKKKKERKRRAKALGIT